MLDGLEHALAKIALGVAVTQLDGLELAGGGAGGDYGAADGAVGQGDLHLDGGVAARIQDLATVDIDDLAHGQNLSLGF